MNKSELIDQITDKSKLPRKRAEMVVNLIFDSMTEALARGERIEIRGFGSFISK
ncbi:MAG: HU family DNA-binding protein, partial [Myxococcota bacterium]